MKNLMISLNSPQGFSPSSSSFPMHRSTHLDDFGSDCQAHWKKENSAIYTHVMNAAIQTRKTFKSNANSKEAVWPNKLETALIEGLVIYKPSDKHCSRRNYQRFPKRNKFISDFIYKKTGHLRSPKQVGSRLQQLRETITDPFVKRLLTSKHFPDMHEELSDATAHSHDSPASNTHSADSPTATSSPRTPSRSCSPLPIRETSLPSSPSSPCVLTVTLDATRLLYPLQDDAHPAIDDGYRTPLVLSTTGNSYQFALEGTSPQLVLIQCPEVFPHTLQDTTYSSTFDVYYRQECIYSGPDPSIRLTQRPGAPSVFEAHIASHYWPYLMANYLNDFDELVIVQQIYSPILSTSAIKVQYTFTCSPWSHISGSDYVAFDSHTLDFRNQSGGSTTVPANVFTSPDIEFGPFIHHDSGTLVSPVTYATPGALNFSDLGYIAYTPESAQPYFLSMDGGDSLPR